MVDKALLLNEVRRVLNDKIFKLEELIDSTRAANNETKSSMGDKYETSREMVQQEVNRLLSQLNEAKNQIQSIHRLNSEPASEIKTGSLFQTEKGLFYISTALGEINVGGNKVFAVSPESPLVKALAGKKQGEQVMFNSQKLTVLKIW